MDNKNLKSNAEEKSGHSPLARILAGLGLLIILGFIAALIYSLITGSSANVLLMILFCLMVIPCLFFIIIWAAKLLKK